MTGYVLGGVSVVALAGAGACALRALSLSSDYETEGSGGFRDPDVRSEGIAFRTAADVALGVGLVTGALAVILLVSDIGATKGSDVRRSPAVLRW